MYDVGSLCALCSLSGIQLFKAAEKFILAIWKNDKRKGIARMPFFDFAVYENDDMGYHVVS